MTLVEIHGLSFCNSVSIENSSHCGCFHCKEIFDASEVKEFLTERGHLEKTALCPRCNVDSVLGDFDIPITTEFLDSMHSEFFSKHPNR